MIKVLEVPLQQDLTEFAAFLWQHRIPHRILEQGESQQLWVAPGISEAQILRLYELWQEGADLNQIEVRHSVSSIGPGFDLFRLPVTLALISISALVAFLTGFGEHFEWLRHFTLADLIRQNDSIYTSGLKATLSNGELWRLLTPAFLHFSPAHLIMNLLFIWVAGARIERQQGALVLVSLVLFSGVASNLAQYIVSGPLFGGMSGVVFAVLAYTWLWDRQRNVPERFNLPPAIMGLMVLWLVLGYTGLLEGIGLGAVANTAHLIGLLAGLAWVPMIAMLRR
ncbi:MAG: rhomboid family intramembrane serine protease [Marinobacterium sp.]|nr:rhomboid family intramembrane serine protease [Marinobacterium sp.]